jgi:thioredoxin-like negative regulator of GroEL
MQQFAALGYIDDPGADKEKQAESAEIEAKYNIARTYLWKNEADRAQPLLEEIVRRRPWEDRFLYQLAACYSQAGYLYQAERLLQQSTVRAARTCEQFSDAGKIEIAGEFQSRLSKSQGREMHRPPNNITHADHWLYQD